MMEDKDTKSYFTFNFMSDGKEVTLNFNKQDPRVPEVLEEFMNFLRATGYCFDIDDYFDVANDFKTPDIEYPNNTSDEEAEAKAYQQVFGFETPVPNEWVEYDDNGNAKHFSSTPGFNYKPEDY